MLAIAAAVGWGAADFLGGASRRGTPVLVIVCVSELIGLVVLAPVLILRGVPLPTDPRMLLACLAGCAGTVELSLIYLALSDGDAFITAPVGALGAATAVIVGLSGGDPLTLSIAIGLICALLGGAASAWTCGSARHGGSPSRAAVVRAVAAGAVATMLVCFHASARLDPYWATAVEHVSTALSAGLIVLATKRARLHAFLPQGAQAKHLALVAATGVGGDLAYAAASRYGALSIVSAISSLYPLATVALAAAIQGRRASRLQAFAMIIALAGGVLLGI